VRYLRRSWLTIGSGEGAGLLRAAYHLFVHFEREVELFWDDRRAPRPPRAWPTGYRFEYWPRRRDLDRAARRRVRASAGRLFLASLARRDGVYAVSHGETVVAWGAVFRRSPQRDILGLPSDAVLVGACETAPGHRRRGLYQASLDAVARLVREEGAGGLYAEVLPGNDASMAGLEGTGFLRIGLVRSSVWLGLFSHRQGGWHFVRRW